MKGIERESERNSTILAKSPKPINKAQTKFFKFVCHFKRHPYLNHLIRKRVFFLLWKIKVITLISY